MTYICHAKQINLSFRFFKCFENLLNMWFVRRFLQAAEENSRGAFQSVESLVRAFSSVSMMLESTYHAMYSSFRAVLGVVDNFSRLRLMFTQFLSAITILKIIKNFYRRILYWLGNWLLCSSIFKIGFVKWMD